MITALLAASVISAPAQVTPSQLASKMFAKYADAKKLSGTVSFRQSGGGVTALFDTVIQYERPYKLYIREERRDRKLVGLTVADGTMFTYEMPDNLAQRAGDRLYELQNQKGVVNSIVDVYTIAQPGLLSQSPVLDLLIAKTEHLRFFRGQLASVGWHNGNEPEPGQAGLIAGNWRAYASAPITGKYILAISPEGDVLRYTVNENLSVPGEKPIAVVSQWTVNVKVGDGGDEKLYRVVRR